MEFYKKYGKSSWAKHMRNKNKSPRTKQMANKNSRSKSKIDIINDLNEQRELYLLTAIQNKFDSSEWTW